jgi:hypothetical protein
MKKRFFIVLSLAAIALSSCVQDDMFDLYDEDYEAGFVRMKRNKDYGNGPGSTNSIYYVKRNGQPCPPPDNNECVWNTACIVLSNPTSSISDVVQGMINGASKREQKKLKDKYYTNGQLDFNKVKSDLHNHHTWVYEALGLEGTPTSNVETNKIKSGCIVVTKPYCEFGYSGNYGHMMMATSDIIKNDFDQYFFEGDGYTWSILTVSEVKSF